MILRETQNQNDADDANDAESGIWYRDVLKTASRASSASLSSRKNCAGGLGYAPEMCMWMTTCYASKTRLPPKTMTNKPDTRTNSYMLSGVNHFWFIQKSWLEKVNQFWFIWNLRKVSWYLVWFKTNNFHNALQSATLRAGDRWTVCIRKSRKKTSAALLNIPAVKFLKINERYK